MVWTTAIRRLLVFFGLWLILTRGEADAVAPGLAASLVSLAVSWRLLPVTDGRRIRLLPLLANLPGFFWRSIVGGVDVAWRALHPALPLNPGWLVFASRLPPGARVALGGEFSLMPGTLVAGSDENRLYVHSLNQDPALVDRLRDEERLIESLIAPPRDRGRP